MNRNFPWAFDAAPLAASSSATGHQDVSRPSNTRGQSVPRQAFRNVRRKQGGRVRSNVAAIVSRTPIFQRMATSTSPAGPTPPCSCPPVVRLANAPRARGSPCSRVEHPRSMQLDPGQRQGLPRFQPPLSRRSRCSWRTRSSPCAKSPREAGSPSQTGRHRKARPGFRRSRLSVTWGPAVSRGGRSPGLRDLCTGVRGSCPLPEPSPPAPHFS